MIKLCLVRIFEGHKQFFKVTVTARSEGKLKKKSVKLCGKIVVWNAADMANTYKETVRQIMSKVCRKLVPKISFLLTSCSRSQTYSNVKKN